MLLVGMLSAPCQAQHEHMDLYSDRPDAGQLVLHWDFSRVLPMYLTFCVPSSGECLFTTLNPAFISPEEAAADGLFPLRPGFTVLLELVQVGRGGVLVVNGQRLSESGARVALGEVPFHVHPSWQLVAPRGTQTEIHFAYRLVAEGGAYQDSPVYTSRFRLVEAEPTPTPEPTPEVSICPADCNGDDEVTIDELVTAVNEALGALVGACPAADQDEDGSVMVDELVRGVRAALEGCAAAAGATYAALREELFLPRCALPTCHSARDRVANLDLEARGHIDLVGVSPDNFAARQNGWLRVVPGDPERSFLYHKLRPIAPQYGNQMPLGGVPVERTLVERVRLWITYGAPAD